MAGAVGTADSPLGGSWRDFPSLLKASVLDMPTRVRGAQGCTKIHPWMQCQITGRSQKTGKLGGVNIAYFPNPRACCMAWDICHRWQVLHDQAGKKTGSYNFADAGYEADDKLTALLQEVPTVQQAASLVRKQLLVPPPMPADKRRALTSRGGERLRLPHIGPRARPSSRFTLAADRTLKLHLAGDVYKRKRLLFKDHFFKHVWGGSQPVAAGPQQQQQQQRQQAATAEGDGEDEEEGSEDEEEGSDGEQGSEDEGAAAGRLCRPRPAPLWLTTADGQEVAIGFNRAGKDGWCAKWAELKELLDLLQVTEDDVEQRSLVFQPHASGGAASRPGFLQAAVRLELKAAPQQAAASSAAAAAAAAAGQGAAPAATEGTKEGAGVAGAGTAAPEGAAGAAAAAGTEYAEAQPPAAAAAVALETRCAAAQVQPPEQQQQKQQQQPTTPDAAAAPPQPPPPSSGETSHGEAPAPNLRLLMRRLLKRKPGTSSGGEDAQVQQAQQQQADPAELAGAGSKRPAEKADAACAEVAKSGQPASKRPRHAQQPQPQPQPQPPQPPPPPQQQPQPLPQHAQQQPQPQPQRAQQQQQQQQQQEAEVVDLTMSSDDEDEELDIVGPPGRPAAYAQPPARPVQQAGLGGRGGAAGGMCAGGSTAAPPAPANAAAPGPAAAAAAARSAGRLGKAERYVAVMSRLQGAGVTGEAYKAASDRYRALPDILRSMWHSRFMAAADGAAVQQAVAELLGGAPGGAHA